MDMEESTKAGEAASNQLYSDMHDRPCVEDDWGLPCV